jgi:fibronectin type 3 domain-containing protein
MKTNHKKLSMNHKNWLLLMVAPVIILAVVSSCTKESSDTTTTIGIPGGVTATPGINSFTIKWNAVSGATYYRIYWSNQNSGVTTTSNMIDKIGNTQYEHTGVELNKTYYYRVSAVNSQGQGELSSVAQAEIQITIPPTPGNLHVNPGESKLAVSWDAVGMAQNYKLYWTSDGTEPTTGSTLIDNITANSYEHTGLDHTKTYKYAVLAVNQFGSSPLSASAQGQPQAPPLLAPTGLSAWWYAAVNLTWNAYPVAGATITVMRGTQVIAEGLTGVSYSDANPVAGKANEYKIKAVVPGVGESPWSAVVIYKMYISINESERNGPETTLTTLDWCYYREHSTEGKECIIIDGNYSGAYAGYNAYLYKNYDWDIFGLDWQNVMQVKVEVLHGTIGGLWGMEFDLGVCNSYNHDMQSPASSISGTTYIWDTSPASNTLHMYLLVSMPDDLINYGPYNYSIRVTLTKTK